MDDEHNPEFPPKEDSTADPPSVDSPEEKAKSGWTMPEPVFRQTSGYLPKGFEKKVFESDSPKPLPDAPNEILSNLYAPPETESPPVDEQPTSPAGPEIQPQPEISEQFTIDQINAAPAAETKPKSGLLRVILIVLGVLAMLGLAFGFLILVYFLFFYSQPEVNNF